ncbi:glycosyltransferase [bacterium]|nr:glycosyltransferase [bacterium]
MISVVYAVHNEEKILARSLQSVQQWTDEIVVVDGESTDTTAEIAKSFGARVIETTNKANFHINKQMAIDKATGDVILQLDADEVVDEQFRDFVQMVDRERPSECVAWYIKRKNLFFRRWLTKGGQYPDMVIRLFYREKAYLPQKDVHEQMTVDGAVGVATGHLLHFANPDLASYWRKFDTYTSFKAAQLAEEKVPINKFNFFKYWFWKPAATFWSIWLRHRGYVDGGAGFLFALFSGWHHLVAYAKYVENERLMPEGKIQVYVPGNSVEKKQDRGVGRYTRWLLETLEERGQVTLTDKRETADIVHYPWWDLYKATLQKVNSDQKLVVTVHDIIPYLFPDDYPVGIMGKINFWRQRHRLRQATMVIADSNATKKDVSEKFHLDSEKIKVVYLAANPNLQPASNQDIVQVKKSYALSERYILYVGDINFNKNLPQLIKALKFVDDQEMDLVMVGKNFVPQEIPEWQVISEQLDLSEVKNRVKFLTSVTTDRELSALYSGASVYVQPSYYEGFGLPVLEAMSCGCPVVCAKNSSLSEVGGQAAIYAASTRAEDLAAAINKVQQLTAKQRQEVIEQGQSWAATFTWDKTAARVEKVYAQVVAAN